MSNELRCFTTSGKNVYSIITNPGGSGWNGTSFTAITSGLWPIGAVQLNEVSSGTGIYMGNFPVSINQLGIYSCFIYSRPGTGAAPSDTFVTEQIVNWNGSQILVYPMDLADYIAPDNVSIDDIKVSTDQLTFDSSGNVYSIMAQPAEDSLVNELLDLANSIESGESIRQTLRLIRATLDGQATVSNNIVQYKRKDGSTVAISVTHDNSGNRTVSTDGNLN